MLSGTGSDGAEGLRKVKAEGGMTIVQQPETAEYDGMPRSAINTGWVDQILPIDEMVDVLTAYVRHPYVQARAKTTLADTAPDHNRAIISLLRAHTNHDFSQYKKGTLKRRIDRRMGIRNIEEPADYLKLLRAEPDEVHSLFQDMLIGATQFFRDPMIWEDLAKIFFQRMANRSSQEPFRVWVPGCATGEEAYTIPALVMEQQEQQNKRGDAQVSGTDINMQAITQARSGIFPDRAAKDISCARLESNFTREGDKLKVKKRLRESCIFAVQNLLSDPQIRGTFQQPVVTA